MLAMVAFQHRDLQVLNSSPTCLELTLIMSVSCIMIGIRTLTVSTLPVNFPCLAIFHSWLTFLSPQLCCHLLFHYLSNHTSNCLLSHFLHLASDLLQDRFPFFVL